MAKVKDFINEITGTEEDREKAKKEVAQLVTLANSKLDYLEAELKDLFRNRELESQIQIVGDRMGAFSREYRVNYSDGNISAAINDLVNQIMYIGSESTRNIVSKGITNALNAMFSSVSATEEEKRLFIVTLEGVALVRYDFYVWRSAECDKSIFTHATGVVAITYARSVVDHRHITEDELNDAIYQFLGGGGEEKIKEVIKYKEELIKLLNIKATEGNYPIENSILNSDNMQKLSNNQNKDLKFTNSITHMMNNIKIPNNEELNKLLEVKSTEDRLYIDEIMKQ